MKVLVIGYGSMGRRRIRLYKQIEPTAHFICVDSNNERLKQVEHDGHTPFANLDDAIQEKPDLAYNFIHYQKFPFIN